MARAASERPRVRLLTGNMVMIDTDDNRLREMRYIRPTYGALRAEGMILTNQAAFWHRNVHERIGYLSESLTCAFDYEWFLRVAEQFEGWHVNEVWGGLRIHEATKSQKLAERFADEMDSVRRQRPFSRWKIPLYRARRAFLMMMRGDASYVASGVADRLRSKLTGAPRVN